MDIIRLIASDLDATLLDGQSRLPPDFAETVRALAEQGIRFAAASGRPIYTLEEMFAPLRDDIIFVGDNGGASQLLPPPSSGRSYAVPECPGSRSQGLWLNIPFS